MKKVVYALSTLEGMFEELFVLNLYQIVFDSGETEHGTNVCVYNDKDGNEKYFYYIDKTIIDQEYKIILHIFKSMITKDIELAIKSVMDKIRLVYPDVSEEVVINTTATFIKYPKHLIELDEIIEARNTLSKNIYLGHK